MIVTSETNIGYEEILSTYRKLWEIEASFRLTKTQFSLRPVFASTEHGIRGHFFICYLALTLVRLLQKKELNSALNAEQIIDFIKTLKSFPISNEQYMLSGSHQEVIKEIEARYHLKFNSKIISSSKVEKLFFF